MVTLNPLSSRLKENTVKAKSLILSGLTLMNTELNIGLEFQPCYATRMNWPQTIVHYMRKIWSVVSVKKLSNSFCVLRWKSCFIRQQVRLLQSKKVCFHQTVSMRCFTSQMNSCKYCWFFNRIIPQLYFLGYQCLARMLHLHIYMHFIGFLI